MRSRFVLVALLVSTTVHAADQFIRPTSSIVALAHVGVIDGTGGPARDGQTIIIEGGRIVALGDAAAVTIPTGATTIDLRGRTVIPGLVGMHDHLFYQIQPADDSINGIQAQRTFAKLYLAAGVTTIRTAGTMDFDGDLGIKRQIDAGHEAGPKIHLTGPFLHATTAAPAPDGIAKQVATYADRGATSFKAYTTLRTSELKAAIAAAHERGLTVTGHVCAVGFREAAAAGIDNLEHGVLFDSEMLSWKRPDECPKWDGFDALIRTDVADVKIKGIIDTLVRHRVALTSTLAVIESYAIDETEIDPRVLVVLSTRLHGKFQQARDLRKDRTKAGQSSWSAALAKEMAFERAFVKAGGILMAGADPTGWGAVLAGYGNQRGLELLVSAGFTPEQAIQIATSNGATFLKDRTVGRVAEGMRADLVVVRGKPSREIADVRNVELVFKDGTAYDPQRLTAAAAGTLGELTFEDVFMWSMAVLMVLLLVGRRAVRVIRQRHPAPADSPA